MSDQLSVAEFYERVLPEQFAAAMAEAPPEATDQPELTATYDITGEGGGVYGLRAANGQLEVVPGGIDNSDLHTTVSIDNWRRAVIHARNDPLITYIQRRKVNAVKNLKGALQIEIERDDGSNYESTTIYGGSDTPEVTLRMKAEDYRSMVEGKLNGQMAFMTGKLKFEGSLPFLMQLAAASF